MWYQQIAEKLDEFLRPRGLGHVEFMEGINELIHHQILEDLGNKGVHVGDQCCITGIVLSGALL